MQLPLSTLLALAAAISLTSAQNAATDASVANPTGTSLNGVGLTNLVATGAATGSISSALSETGDFITSTDSASASSFASSVLASASSEASSILSQASEAASNGTQVVAGTSGGVSVTGSEAASSALASASELASSVLASASSAASTAAAGGAAGMPYPGAVATGGVLMGALAFGAAVLL